MKKKITNYTEIKTFEDACKVLKLDPKKVLPNFKAFPAKDRKAMAAHAKLILIAKAVNKFSDGGKQWKADFGNHSQDKYYPWFYHPSGGSSGFRSNDYDTWHSHTNVGSRLCFPTYEVAKFVGETFVKLYNEYFL